MEEEDSFKKSNKNLKLTMLMLDNLDKNFVLILHYEPKKRQVEIENVRN